MVAAGAIATAATLVLAGRVREAEQVSGGTTSLKISANVGEFLADTGTKVKVIDPAREKKKGYGFPIASGELDNKKVEGTLKHRGGLELKGDGGKFELTRLQAKFGRSSKLKAKLDGKNSALFDLDTENAKAKESDGTIKVNGVKVLLSAKGLRLIEDVTEMELEDRDVVFGKLKVAAETGGGEVTIDGGDANSRSTTHSRAAGCRQARSTPPPRAPAGSDSRSLAARSRRTARRVWCASTAVCGSRKGGANIELTKPAHQPHRRRDHRGGLGRSGVRCVVQPGRSHGECRRC